MSVPALYEPVGGPVWAVRWDGHNVAEVLRLVDKRFFNRTDPEDTTRAAVYTAEVYDYLHGSWIGVKDGDYIIRGEEGEFYPNDGKLFARRYRAVECEPR